MRDLIKKILRESEEEFDWVPDIEEMSITLKSLFDSDRLEIGDVIIVTGEIREHGGRNRLYTRLDNTPLKLHRKDYDKDGITSLHFEWVQPKETRPSGWNIVSTSGYFDTDKSTINTTDGNLIVSGIIKPSEFIKESE